jgi:CubicO group peptidase (beta-lactamase class C family)
VEWTAAVGLGGQRLYVIPDLDMVVALNSGMYTSDRQGRVALQVLDRYVMPAVEHSG